NPSNNDLDNLAFLCLDHHDAYDQKTSQSKGLTVAEVKRYRSLLAEALAGNAGTNRYAGGAGQPQQVNAAVYVGGSVHITGSDAFKVVGPNAVNISGPMIEAAPTNPQQAEFRPPFYFIPGETIPICPQCWEGDSRKIHL